MVADDTAGSGDRSEEETEMDRKMPVSEDGGHEDGDVNVAASASEAPSASEGPPEQARGPKNWKWSVIFLCMYGFLSSIKPGESFITPNLLSSEKNFTREQVSGTPAIKPSLVGCQVMVKYWFDIPAVVDFVLFADF